MTTKMKKRTRAEAKRLMWEHYRENKEFLPKWIREYREDIILGVQNGSTVEQVFQFILGSAKSVMDQT